MNAFVADSVYLKGFCDDRDRDYNYHFSENSPVLMAKR